MKTFESSNNFSYVWVGVAKKVPYTSPSAFDRFTGHSQGLCLKYPDPDIRKIIR